MSEESSAKKRKLRKGTHSCWECKRRKARCVFSNGHDRVCVGCRRRGTNCVNQNESEVEPETKDGATNRRLLRIEAMLETLLERQAVDGAASKSKDGTSPVPDVGTRGIKIPDAFTGTVRRKRALSPSPEVEFTRKLSPKRSSIPHGLSGTLSETLYSLLPSHEECQRVCSSSKFLPCFFQQMLTRDWKTMSASHDLPILTSSRVAILPSPDVHPILLAQKMLMLACLAQFISQELNDDDLKYKAEHMASAAIDVVAKEELCHNAEGLECLMLEATYHANNGDMRRAFSAVRRAMACGQLLGIHRSDQLSIQQLDKAAPPFDPTYMWYRVVSADRLFSLVLGLPQGYSSTLQTPFIDVAALDPEQQLEKRHNEIASWILDRNERDPEDILATQTIDQALQDAITILPSDWWLPPALHSITSRRDMFLETTRLVNQVLHFNLINQTHLPYLHLPGPLYGYSKAACAAASREILVRYLILQDSGSVAHTCHVVKFFSLIAATTLTLAHLERHWEDTSQELSVLAHVRASDRAMVQRAGDYMARLPACKGAQIIEHLLQIEDEAFRTRSVGSGAIVKDYPDEGPFFEMGIPYFGQLRLNSAKICFRRAADIEDVSLGVKNRGDYGGGEQMLFYEGLDFSAFVGDVGAAEVAAPFEL
ncbi:hypothetical protein P171DRAFT_468660 [Karstenula rhodostoma CBS 690.94]|uniref:Zn(2)-C6 fungal-type domain-containing protein n=1 Tax=Karstenula rhodostoma CBS 690.94 TaxID=1392251 RepID=A0A9P4UFQ5_9PLEO|nr:hypothetical protein P171DRAFT_468660 [Karstenula rhodostoma CBS 690.94]